MKKLITYSTIILLFAFAACNQKSNNTQNADGTTTLAVDSANAFNTSDLKQLAAAINATNKDDLQVAIDAIKNMDVKYWAIAVTVKSDNGLVEAIQKTQNQDIKLTAYVMSGNDTTQTEQMLAKINEADLKSVANAYLHRSEAASSIEQIKNARLKNLALSITASTPEDKSKYANAISE